MKNLLNAISTSQLAPLFDQLAISTYAFLRALLLVVILYTIGPFFQSATWQVIIYKFKCKTAHLRKINISES